LKLKRKKKSHKKTLNQHRRAQLTLARHTEIKRIILACSNNKKIERKLMNKPIAASVIVSMPSIFTMYIAEQ